MMRKAYIYTLFIVIALSAWGNMASAQVKKAKKPVVKAKSTKAKAKTTSTSKKIAGLASALPDSASKGGGTKLPTPNEANPGSSLSEEIVVTTAYKPLLAEAVKIRRNPDLEDFEPFKAPLTYAPLDKPLGLNTDIKQFDAIKLPAERPAELSNNYIKLGAGNLKTTYGELYIDNGRDEGLQIGGFLKHLAQSGSQYKQDFNKDEAGVFGKAIGDVNDLSWRVNYTLNQQHFYGYDPLQAPTVLLGTKQYFSTLEAETELSKNYKDEENLFIYSLKLGGYTFHNAFKAKENNVVLSGYINQTVSQFYAGLSGSVDFNSSTDSLYSINNSIVRVNPYLKFQGTGYKVDAGFQMVDEFGTASRISLFPAARLEFQVVPKYVRLFAEVRGDVNKASIRDFAEQNPFITQNINLQNSVDKLDISAGLKGMFAPGFGFKASVFRNSVNDMPLFISNFNSSSRYNSFNVIYDKGNALVTGLNAELDCKPGNDFDIFGKAEIRNYAMATETQAWNLPKLKITAGTTIHLNSKIDINGSLVFRSATTDSLANNQIKSLPAFVDVSGGIDYKVSTRFAIFAQANNLLSNNYQMWLYYPNYGFNIFGGLSYKF